VSQSHKFETMKTATFKIQLVQRKICCSTLLFTKKIM
jgi:hypothetical protein